MDEKKYKDFTQKMEQSYPKMFARGYGGIGVGEGWWKILENLCFQIQQHVSWKREQRAQDLVFNRRLKRAIEARSIAPFVEAYKRNTGQEPSKWTIDNYEEALVTEEFREVTEAIPQVRIRQIKEKFGGLRFYYDGGDEFIHGLVRMAESWASTVCEQCGEPGMLRHGGWVQTLCDKHEAERQEEYRKRYGDNE